MEKISSGNAGYHSRLAESFGPKNARGADQRQRIGEFVYSLLTYPPTLPIEFQLA